jgi:hypothetical protein
VLNAQSRPPGLSYSVQLGVVRQPMDEAPFQDIGAVMGELFGAGLTRYTVGSFVDMAAADAALQVCDSSGI